MEVWAVLGTSTRQNWRATASGTVQVVPTSVLGGASAAHSLAVSVRLSITAGPSGRSAPSQSQRREAATPAGAFCRPPPSIVKDPDAEARAAAARALGRTGQDEEPIPALRSALKDEDAKVRADACTALAE